MCGKFTRALLAHQIFSKVFCLQGKNYNEWPFVDKFHRKRIQKCALLPFYNHYNYYKPFYYAFDRFKLRDVYFSLWGNLLVRFQATELHKFGLVWKALAHRWFLTYVWPLNGTVVCTRLKKSKNHHHTIYNLVRNASSHALSLQISTKLTWLLVSNIINDWALSIRNFVLLMI
jgi:hypothetical protein